MNNFWTSCDILLIMDYVLEPRLSFLGIVSKKYINARGRTLLRNSPIFMYEFVLTSISELLNRDYSDD